jgi:hypothetical protein
MNKYDDIDPILSDWAKRNGITWLTNYQDAVVRTFLVEPESRRRVQIWVDPTNSGWTTVHIFQNNGGRRWKKEESYPCNVNDLPSTLDKAFEKVMEWIRLT